MNFIVFIKKKAFTIFLFFTLFFMLISLLSVYKTNSITGADLASYKLFLSEPGSMIDEYHHWLPNLIGASIVKISGQYSIFLLRFSGMILILFNCVILYKIMINFFDKILSLFGVFFSYLFVLKNYTILNSSLITGSLYMLFTFFVVQAILHNKDYLFFLAGICLAFNFFTDSQNLLCLLCILGIFIYYKIANVSNINQNKQFMPLTAGIIFTCITIIIVMKISGQLVYYITSVKNSYRLFQNSIGIYSSMNVFKNFIPFFYTYSYWPILIIVLLVLFSKLINFKSNKYLYTLGIIITSFLIFYFIKENCSSVFIGISFAVLLLYIFNIKSSSYEFRLLCILAFIMEVLSGIGILRQNGTIIYGTWIGMFLVFTIGVKLIVNNFKISVDKNINMNLFNINPKDFSFIFVSLFLVFILCSIKTIYNNNLLFFYSNSSPFSNTNYFRSQIRNESDFKELKALSQCITKYSGSSNYLLVQNDINILYFTTDKIPFLGYTIYDQDSIPMNIQINDNMRRNNFYPIIVIKKPSAYDTYYTSVSDFVKKNRFKSVYKSSSYEIFIPIAND